jgi:SAM-dependent methyltransferase
LEERFVGILSVLSYAHKLVGENVQPGEPVIDATAGGGNDTLFLARLVGLTGSVYAFDIQAEALQQTRERFAREQKSSQHVRFILDSHASMLEHIPLEDRGQIAAVMFNLGYLPHGDRALITSVESTLPALRAALSLLRSGGLLTIVVYPGHDGGDLEAQAVEEWATELDREFVQTLAYRFLNAKNDSSYLIAIYKK